VAIAREVADHLAVVVRQHRLLAQLRVRRHRHRALVRRLFEVQENERRHLACELHDEIGQALTAVSINLQTLRGQTGSGAAESRLEESESLVARALQQVRDLSLHLCPPLLEQAGLVSALRRYVGRLAQRTGLAAEVTADPLGIALSSRLEATCFRVAQEALTNVVRHSRARHVAVALRLRGGKLRLRVVDDGIGFDVQAALQRAHGGASLGLLSMRQRVRFVRGRLGVLSTQGQGTEVRASFPLSGGTRGKR
jgi:signal transduction histidine kinase